MRGIRECSVLAVAGVVVIPRIKKSLMWVFLLFSLSAVTWYKLSQPRVLVLHSYAPDYSWTRDVDIGLKRVLDTKLGYKVQWHYMDTKNHPELDFKTRAGVLAKRAIDALQPHLIIAIDDDAHRYAVKDLAGDPRISIVFAGINGSVEPYGYHKVRNATGIYERRPLAGLRRALLDMRGSDGKPMGFNVVLVGDKSDSVKIDAMEIQAFDWKPFKVVEADFVDTFDEWKEVVLAARSKGDLLLVTNYRDINQSSTQKTLVAPAEIMSWTEANSPVPVIGAGGYMVEDGGMFAIGVSGFEQGETAARMAIQIIDQAAIPSNIPPILPDQFLVYTRHALMEKRGISLPAIYEAFARASNNFHK